MAHGPAQPMTNTDWQPSEPTVIYSRSSSTSRDWRMCGPNTDEEPVKCQFGYEIEVELPLYISWRKCDPFITHSLCVLAGVSPRRFDWMGGEGRIQYLTLPTHRIWISPSSFTIKSILKINKTWKTSEKYFITGRDRKKIWGAPPPSFFLLQVTCLPSPHSRLRR